MHLSSVWGGIFLYLSRGLAKKTLPVNGLRVHGRTIRNLAHQDEGAAWDEGCSALTAHPTAWPQHVAGHPALDSASRISLAQRILSEFLVFLCLQT